MKNGKFKNEKKPFGLLSILSIFQPENPKKFFNDVDVNLVDVQSVNWL